MSSGKTMRRSVIIETTNAVIVEDSVIINQGDENGNVILNRSGASGANAHAGP